MVASAASFPLAFLLAAARRPAHGFVVPATPPLSPGTARRAATRATRAAPGGGGNAGRVVPWPSSASPRASESGASDPGSAASPVVESLAELLEQPEGTRDDAAVRRLLLQLRDDVEVEEGTGAEGTPPIATTTTTTTARTSVATDNAASHPPPDHRFEPLLGHYQVTHTLPPPGTRERPVGGKWGDSRNRFASLRASHQHLLPPLDGAAGRGSVVAQVVNLVSVQVLGGLLWIYVLLRGDATPLPAEERLRLASERGTPGGLSDRTVRADFDPPRIVVVVAPVKASASDRPPVSAALRPLFSASLGPKSSVVLDTPYCRGALRIGKGSRGSWFVFRRLMFREEDEASELWKSLWNVKPVGRPALLGAFGGAALLSSVASARLFVAGWSRWNRLWSVPLSVACAAAALMVALSTGGIQRDDNRRSSGTGGASRST